MKKATLLLPLAYLAFISLGLPDAVTGVAWPSIHLTFSIPLSHLGLLLAASMCGYLLTSFLSGTLVSRFGVGTLLFASTSLVALALIGYALTAWWFLMLALAFLVGCGSGAIDAGINTYAARHFSPRHVNFLHASYGIGATLGPLIMSTWIARAAGSTPATGFRAGYATLAAMLAAMSLCFLFTLKLWNQNGSTEQNITPSDTTNTLTAWQALRLPRIWLGILLFFIYTGLEATAGQWAYSLLTTSRGFSPTSAGRAVALFWLGLTLGRLLFGIASSHLPPRSLLTSSMLAAPLAATLLWLRLSPAIDFLSLFTLGLSCAPVYPLLISLTPARVGPYYAHHAVGFQVAAACLGAAVLPATAGLLTRHFTLESIPPFLLASACTLLILYLASSERLAAPLAGQVPEPFPTSH